jgi:hypothetical protein
MHANVGQYLENVQITAYSVAEDWFLGIQVLFCPPIRLPVCKHDLCQGMFERFHVLAKMC